MTEILTTEEVSQLLDALTAYSRRVQQLGDGHETLRVCLAEAQQQLMDEQVRGVNLCLDLAVAIQAMQEMEADVRALAKALQMYGDSCCSYCESRRANALARPGVVRLLAKKEAE